MARLRLGYTTQVQPGRRNLPSAKQHDKEHAAMKTAFNPFFFQELLIEQSLKGVQTLVKMAEANEKMVVQALDFQRKNRDEAVKVVEQLGEQAKANTRLWVDMAEKVLAYQVQGYKQASKASIDEFNKQVAQFSKS
jgi:hypothetical protein